MSRPSGEISGGFAGAFAISDPKEVFIMFPAPNCDERLYESQKKFLESKGHKVHVEYVIDSMGIEDYAKYVMEKYPGRVNLVGTSVGAHIALECWAIAPERVRSMTLISMKTETPSDEKQAKREVIVRDLTNPEICDRRLIEIAGKVAETNFSEKAENIEELKALYMDMTRKMGPKAFATQAGYMVQVGKEGVFARANHRVLSEARYRSVRPVDTLLYVVVGKDDRRFAVSGDGRDVDKIAGDIARDTVANIGLSVNLAMIDGAGHLSAIEKAEKVNDIMGEVLSKINPRGRVR